MRGPLALVGYMGSGKTTVGRALAGQLGWQLLDLDAAIAERAGLSIPEIFASSGEPRFRELERRELIEALDGPRERVVSCGGGVVIDPRNRALLRQVPTVFLWEDADVLYRRTRGSGRPLRGASFEDFSRRYAERLPYYLEVASLHLEPGGRPPRRVADEIVEWLKTEAA
ncbi:MAG: shikimate kinase [Actinobacteria bacterium]|jgi:shikimate kinase|nr:shikimate kinase [Actinomycetota bacterium]PLS83980.1 MAG: shikimate kinase [Actinomycetota bacterium]